MIRPILYQRKIKHLVSINVRNLSIPNEEISGIMVTNDPLENQETLEKLNGLTSFECFYSLSLKDQDPFYISETIEAEVDANFQDINLVQYQLRNCSSYNKLRQKRSFTLKIFARNHRCNNWIVLFDRKVDLNLDLGYQGKTLSCFESSEANSILISLADGNYSIQLVPVDEYKEKLKDKTEVPDKVLPEEAINGLPIANYDTTMKLNNLKSCLIDIEAINEQLIKNIDESLTEKGLDKGFTEKVLKIKLTGFRRTINIYKKRNYELNRKLANKRKHLSSIVSYVEDGNDISIQDNQQTEIEHECSIDKITFKYEDDNDDKESDVLSAKDHEESDQFNSTIIDISNNISELKQAHGKILNELDRLNLKINRESSEIFKAILEMYDIQPNPTNPIEFTILNLTLSNLPLFIKYPNYRAHRPKEDDLELTILSKDDLQIEIDSALGYVAQVVQLIALYLLIPLKYPIISFGSYSYVRDYVSNLNDKSNRIFPLHMKNNLIFRFEYALTLLNRDLEQLMYHQRLSVPDPKNILGNLKTLLLFLSSKDLVRKAI